jgi:hypothetical protein
MELALQFGWGMMDHCTELLSAWGAGTVILSPRDLKPEQLPRFAERVASAGGGTLLDPQFYLPHADHERLTSHEYWPKQYATGDFWSGSEFRTLLDRLETLNESVGSYAAILPGLHAEHVDEDWLVRQRAIVDASKATTKRPRLATVALGADALRSNDEVDLLLADIESWDVQGIYLVCEHPRGDYLVADATWITNQLDMVAGVKLKGKSVVVGYANHQQLLLGCAAADVIASGTWMNVRSFPPEKFRAQYEEEIKRRSTWYYCPQALSEYTLPYLDIAQRQGLLSVMAPPAKLGSNHADALFSGAQPSATGWSEQSAFRHYLQSLRSQIASAFRPTFDETLSVHEETLDEASQFLGRLRTAGVSAQARDFGPSIDANRAALAVLKASRGGLLRRKWNGFSG